MALDPNNLPKLGKAPKEVDPKNRTLKMAHFFRRLNFQIAAAVCWTVAVTVPWGMMLNDTLGCCALAAPAHQIMAWTANAQGAPVITPDPVINTIYNQLSPNDTGLSMLRFLKYWRKNGIGGHKILGFAEVDHTNVEHIKATIDWLGGVYIGFDMPKCVQTQEVWDIPDEGLTGDGEPGSWGGHAVQGFGYGVNPEWKLAIVGYNQDGVILCSWGRLFRATWRFIAAYCDEMYAVLSADWVNRDTGQCPLQIDLPALYQAIERVAA